VIFLSNKAINPIVHFENTPLIFIKKNSFRHILIKMLYRYEQSFFLSNQFLQKIKAPSRKIERAGQSYL
jgi:hypothetical protein